MSSAPDRSGPLEQFLLVAVGEHACALPVPRVRSVVPALNVFPLPATDPNLLGLAEYEGEPLPIFDLAGLVGAPPGPAAEFPVTVVVRAGGGEAVGLAADAALRLATLPGAGVGSGVVREAVEMDGKVVHVLDLEALGGR